MSGVRNGRTRSVTFQVRKTKVERLHVCITFHLFYHLRAPFTRGI
jgi:hypothetical protein